MEKKYKIFISSTKDDLKGEREKIQNTLLSMDCIPKNMETFYATDLSTWDHIKNVLSTCDYCVIIIAARYGSICKQTGKSFTQMEYEYAKMINVPIGRFIHEDPNSLPFIFHDETEEKKKKFQIFRKELQEGQIVKYWTNSDELCCLIAIAIHQFIISNIKKIDNKSDKNIEIISKLNRMSASFNAISNYILSNGKYDIRRRQIYYLSTAQNNVINDNILNEVANIVLSAGITSMSTFLGIRITANLIKSYVSNNYKKAKQIIDTSNCISVICKFEGYIYGQIILTIHNIYLRFIFNILKKNELIDLSKFDEKFIDSFYKEIANIYFSACLSGMSGFWEVDNSHLVISECTNNIDFKLINNKTYIFEMSSNVPQILTSYLLLDEIEASNLSSYIQLYEDNMKYL